DERARRGSARRGWSAATSEGWSNLRPKPWHGASKGRDVRSGNLFTTHAGGLDAEHESAGRSTAASTWDGTALCHSERSLGHAPLWESSWSRAHERRAAFPGRRAPGKAETPPIQFQRFGEPGENGPAEGRARAGDRLDASGTGERRLGHATPNHNPSIATPA